MEEKELNVEERARAQGWVPEDEWRGDPGKYVDAETFVARGDEIGAVRKERLSALEKKIAKLEAANAKFGTYHQETISRLENQYAAQVEAIKSAQRQAVVDGDVEKFDALEKQAKSLETVKTEQVSKVQETSQQADMKMVLQEWLDDGNEWYLENPKLADEAFKIGDRISITRPHLQGRAQLDEITRIIKKNYPEQFGANGEGDQVRRSTSVQSGEGAAPAKGKTGKSYADLPKEAKRLCDEFCEAIPGFTKDQFVKNFDWGTR